MLLLPVYLQATLPREEGEQKTPNQKYDGTCANENHNCWWGRVLTFTITGHLYLPWKVHFPVFQGRNISPSSFASDLLISYCPFSSCQCNAVIYRMYWLCNPVSNYCGLVPFTAQVRNASVENTRVTSPIEVNGEFTPSDIRFQFPATLNEYVFHVEGGLWSQKAYEASMLGTLQHLFHEGDTWRIDRSIMTSVYAMLKSGERALNGNSHNYYAMPVTRTYFCNVYSIMVRNNYLQSISSISCQQHPFKRN